MPDVELFKSDGNSLKSLKVLTESEFSSIKEHGSTLMEFQRHHALIEYVITNFNTLNDLFVNKTKEIAYNMEGSFHYPFGNFYLEVNTVILNFLSSARIFLEHMDTHIKKEFTVNSPQYSIFRESTVNEFDNKFSYRLMGKLRNYVTHCGMPPLSYNLSKKNEEDDQYTKIILTMDFNRDQLLNGYDGWGAIVRKDLLESNDSFPATPLFNEYIYSLIKIHLIYTNSFVISEVINAKDKILHAINEPEGYSENNYHCGLINPKDNPKDGLEIRLQTIPASLLSKVYHFERLDYLIKNKPEKDYFQYDELIF